MMIKIYTTPMCHYCKDVKEYLTLKGLEFKTFDVLDDLEARKEMIEISGQMGVPVIDIDGKIIIGFNKEKLDESIRT